MTDNTIAGVSYDAMLVAGTIAFGLGSVVDVLAVGLLEVPFPSTWFAGPLLGFLTMLLVIGAMSGLFALLDRWTRPSEPVATDGGDSDE